MDQRFVLFCLILAYFSAFAKAESSPSLVPPAIKAIIDGYFAEKVQAIEVINFGEKNGRGVATVESFLKLGDVSIPMKVTMAHSLSHEFKLNLSSILFFDSPENFKQTQKRIVFQHGNLISHPHLVYIHNALMNDIQVAAYKKHTIDKTMFFVNEKRESIELTTSFMFSPGACHKNKFRVINRFTRQQKRWEKSEFLETKNMNFYGCQLEVSPQAAAYFTEEFNYFDEEQEKTVSVVNTVTAYMDFFTPEEMLKFSTYAIDIQSRKIFIPPGELYGDFEKMLLPFDTPTWIAIVSLILVTIVAILIFKLMPPEIQEVIFGRSNRSPLMNFISIVLNGGQAMTMVENVPRVLLMTFIFWTLIFR
jgi:hypothetical protein